MRKRLISSGHKRTKNYTWDHYARALLAVLDDFEPLRRCWKSDVRAAPPKALSDVALELPALHIAVDLRLLTREASGGVTPLIAETMKELHKHCPDWRIDFFCTIFSRNVIDIRDDRIAYHCLPIDDYYGTMERILAAKRIQVLLRPFPHDDDLDFPLEQQISSTSISRNFSAMEHCRIGEEIFLA